MRTIVSALLLFLITGLGNASAQESGVSPDSCLSHYGCQHKKFHKHYQKLYSKGKCSCRSGHCRPTYVRLTQFKAKTGLDVQVDGKWVPVPEGSLRHESKIPADLFRELSTNIGKANGHVCAYEIESRPGEYKVECVVPFLLG